MLLAAANRVLRGEIAQRARALIQAGDDEFTLAPDGAVQWRGGAVGRLVAGDTLLAPRAEPLPGDFLEGHLRESVRQRLAAFAAAALERDLPALYTSRQAELSPPARGLVFQLTEALGTLPAREVAPLCAGLTGPERKALARLGVRLGTESVYVEPLLKPAAARLKALLWALRSGAVPPAALSGTAMPRDPALADDAYAALGYRVLGPRVLRVDRLERLAAASRKLARAGPFAASPALAQLAGAPLAELAAVLTCLGYRAVIDSANGAVTFHARPRRASEPGRGAKTQRGAPETAANSPFAKLRDLRLAR
jgi:ATP-dependent RNA helicase SUPV3L1/SUV3